MQNKNFKIGDTIKIKSEYTMSNGWMINKNDIFTVIKYYSQVVAVRKYNSDKLFNVYVEHFKLNSNIDYEVF